MPKPTKDEIQLENPSLHAVLADACDDDAQHFTILNSWGSSFGIEGYLFMHYEYILNKQRAYELGRMMRLVKAMFLCSEIGGYFDIKF